MFNNLPKNVDILDEYNNYPKGLQKILELNMKD